MDLDPDEFPPIVVDNGSSTVRAGFAGDDSPRAVFSNIVGQRKHGISESKNYIGDEAQSKRDMLSLNYPVQHGIIANWDDMEKVWNHMFSELKISPEERPVFFGDPPFNPRGHKEKLMQVMFETYNTPAFCLAMEPVLILVSHGFNCGTVLNVGEGCTYTASFFESYSPLQAMVRHDFGGRDLTTYLQHLLHRKGYTFTTTSEFEIVREMKEKLFLVAPQKKGLTSKTGQFQFEPNKTFKLPDGTDINIAGSERYECPEIMFEPDGVFNSTGEGLHQMVARSINSCDISYHRALYCNILLSGASTFFPGFQERLKNEIIDAGPWEEPMQTRVRVIDRPERKYHVWIGGSILASLSTMKNRWITRAEYQEYGPIIVHRKCGP